MWPHKSACMRYQKYPFPSLTHNRINNRHESTMYLCIFLNITNCIHYSNQLSNNVTGVHTSVMFKIKWS